MWKTGWKLLNLRLTFTTLSWKWDRLHFDGPLLVAEDTNWDMHYEGWLTAICCGIHDHILLSDGSGSLQQSPYLKSEYESCLTTDGQSVSVSWNKAPIGSYDQILITVRQLQGCWCGALSLTRGRVCRLLLLLVLASAVNLGFESRGTLGHILLSQIRDFFSSPPTSLRATEEVFDPASTRDLKSEFILYNI
jgi:hypothetical protein